MRFYDITFFGEDKGEEAETTFHITHGGGNEEEGSCVGFRINCFPDRSYSAPSVTFIGFTSQQLAKFVTSVNSEYRRYRRDKGYER